MLELRRLEDYDIPLVEKWLNTPHVRRWYEIPHLGVSIEDWMTEIKERHGEYKWLTHLIVVWQGCPIGMCQYYKCVDSLEENFGTLSVKGSYGIDYLIGEETYIGKGLGKKMIMELVNRIFSFEDAQIVTADIDRENKASENTLLSCGFRLLSAESSRYYLQKG